MVYPNNTSENDFFAYNYALGHKRPFVGKIRLWHKLGEWIAHFLPPKKNENFMEDTLFLLPRFTVFQNTELLTRSTSVSSNSNTELKLPLLMYDSSQWGIIIDSRTHNFIAFKQGNAL